MDRLNYYDRLVRNVVIYGMAGFFGISNLIALFLI